MYNRVCYNVIDSRYRSRKPLIITTNLTLDSLQNPLDTAHARIYDRLLEMCAPILFTGENFRRETAQAKLNRLKKLMGSPQSRKALRGEEEQGNERSFPLQLETEQNGLCDDEMK